MRLLLAAFVLVTSVAAFAQPKPEDKPQPIAKLFEWQKGWEDKYKEAQKTGNPIAVKDVAARRAAELDNQLNDKNRELWKLKAEVQGAQSHARESRLKTMMLTRSHIKKGEHTLRMLEEMLKRWIRSSGAANVNFSTHGHASDVAAQFEKIERDFVDRYFTHVTNPEYERGQHRVIRVKSGEDPDGGKFGELVIALDDDAGRTLGLRFDLRKDAPDAASVGFVLAMLLKAQTRDFRDFAVIVK